MKPLPSLKKAMEGFHLHSRSYIALIQDALPRGDTFAEDVLSSIARNPTCGLFVLSDSDSRSFMATAPFLVDFCAAVSPRAAQHHSADILLQCYASTSSIQMKVIVEYDDFLLGQKMNTVPPTTEADHEALAKVAGRTGLSIAECGSRMVCEISARLRTQIGRAVAAYYREEDISSSDDVILDVILSKRHGLAQFIRRLRVNSKLAHTLFIPAIVLHFGLDDEAAMIDIHASMNFEFRKEILKIYPELCQRMHDVMDRLARGGLQTSSPPRAA